MNTGLFTRYALKAFCGTSGVEYVSTSASIAIACTAERAIDNRLASEILFENAIARAISSAMKPIRPRA